MKEPFIRDENTVWFREFGTNRYNPYDPVRDRFEPGICIETEKWRDGGGRVVGEWRWLPHQTGIEIRIGNSTKDWGSVQQEGRDSGTVWVEATHEGCKP